VAREERNADKDNRETQRTLRFAEKRNPGGCPKRQPYTEEGREGEKRKMFVIGLRA
jgi:hypothetical protein